MLRNVLFAFFTRRFVGTLFGGFFFDQHLSLFINTLHFYMWIILFILPLILSFTLRDNFLVASIVYTVFIFVVFTAVKLLNFWLHSVFDSEQKFIEEQKTEKEKDTSNEEGIIVENSKPTEDPKPETVTETKTEETEQPIKESKQEIPDIIEPPKPEPQVTTTIVITKDEETNSNTNAPTQNNSQTVSLTKESKSEHKENEPKRLRAPNSDGPRRRIIENEEDDDSSTAYISSMNATAKKSKTSTAAVLGERDSEVSSTIDKEISLQWATEEDTSLKEWTEDDLSDGEIRLAKDDHHKSHRNNNNNDNKFPSLNNSTNNQKIIENPNKENSNENSSNNEIQLIFNDNKEEKNDANLLDDIRNYAFDDFAFYDTLDVGNDRPAIQIPRNVTDNFQSDLDLIQTLTARVDDNSEQKKKEEEKEKKKKEKENRPPTHILFMGHYYPVPFDRLFLLSVLDKNDNYLEILFSIIFATACAWLGCEMVPYFHEFSLVMIWFIVASAQYSLLKSPQPDSCSPRHDHNKMNGYNRSFYFILLSLSLLLLHETLNSYSTTSKFEMYGFKFPVKWGAELAIKILTHIIPYFPLIYLLGLLPQCNTLIMYIMEQINIHAFGSSGSPNIVGTLFDTLRSVAIVAILYGIGISSNFEHNAVFSVYLGVMTGLSFLHSRLVSDPMLIWNSIYRSNNKNIIQMDKNKPFSLTTISEKKQPQSDTPAVIRSNYPITRLIADLIVTALIVAIVTGIHATTLFYYLYPYAFYTICILGCVTGFLGRYFISKLRTPYPWNLFQEPFMESHEHKIFEPKDEPSKVMWFEKLYLLFTTMEQSIFYPLIFLTALTEGIDVLLPKFGLSYTVLITSIVGVKLFRGVFTDPAKHYIILLFTLLFFEFDWQLYRETFMIDFFFASILVIKIEEALMKIDFQLIYMAPWRLSWGSGAHAVLHPLWLPHTVLSIFQVLVSSLMSSPLYPLVGSVVFLISYGRPIKFWERNYKTNRVDNSQIKLSETLENSEAEVNMNNLNSIFYEHILGTLQSNLNSEINSGRLANVQSGDFFLLVSDKLTIMLHIIELANGYTTFQIRGMEFKGTYCQERELEEINKVDYTNSNDNYCFPKKIMGLPKLLSIVDMAQFRWNSWSVVNTSLMLQTYSISLNKASVMLNVYSLRLILIKSYIYSTIYYLIFNFQLENWLTDATILAHLSTINDNYVDMDPIFTKQIDEDFDNDKDGISVRSFDRVYGKWISYCIAKRTNNRKFPEMKEKYEGTVGSPLFKLCYSLSLLARRCLLLSPNDALSTYMFMQRYLQLFKGDFRITSTKDEFVLADVDIMQKVLGPAIRISLRLHQDYFIGEEYDDPETLYNAIIDYENHLVCCHEGDPLWRTSILSNTPNMLSLRKQTDNNTTEENDHMIVSLTLRHMKFRVIKLNREGVRGLWAGQVQELVFLGNTNSERGSIQQLKTVVRNLVNQSCDFPVGYPIYVSPLTVSYSSFWPKALSHLQLPRWLFGKKNVNKT